MFRHNSQKGFTLLEMLVALGIFTVVAVVAVGSLVKIMSLNKKAQTLQTAMNNLTSTLEMISREMRVAQLYDCADRKAGTSGINWGNNMTSSLQKRDCNIVSNPTDRVIAFESQKTAPNGAGGVCHLIHAYAITGSSGNWTLEKAQQSACGQTPTYFKVLDDQNLKLTDYELGIYRPSNGLGAESYAWLFIRLKGVAGVREKEKQYFDVQTSVSQRMSDL